MAGYCFACIGGEAEVVFFTMNETIQLENNKVFLKIASVAAMATAVTTFVLWLLPKMYHVPTTFDEAILLYENSYYLSRQWVNFVHIPLALIAYAGLALVIFRHKPIQSFMGMLWFTIWGTVEMTGITIILFTVNVQWREQYASTDAVQKLVLKNNITAFFDVWDSLFFVLLAAFLLGSAFFGWALWQTRGLGKILSWLFWLAVPLTALIMLSGYAHQTWADTITEYFYPILQPVSRTVMGLCTWKSLDKPTLAAPG